MNTKKGLKYIGLPIISKEKILKDDNNNNNKTSRNIIIVFIIFLSLLLLFCGYSLAKTVEEVIINSNTAIAEPILTVENNPELEITASQNYGIYTFKVKNYNENNKITDVDLKYYIELIYQQDKSINVELFEIKRDNGKEIENKINLNENKTEYLEIFKGQKQEKEYQVKITYNKENIDKTESIADIMQKMQVKVHTEQAEG